LPAIQYLAKNDTISVLLSDSVVMLDNLLWSINMSVADAKPFVHCSHFWAITFNWGIL